MVRLVLAAVLGLVAGLMMMPLSATANGILPGSLDTLTAALTLAADPVPSADIVNFAKAYQAVQGIRQGAEADMVKAVESEGLTVEQFNAIAESQTADPTDTPSVSTEAEESQFNAAIEDIITIRQTAESEMAEAIEDTGLSIERFNEILEQSTQDQTLSERIGEQIKALP